MAKYFTPEVEKFLEQLIAACGISGDTREVADLVRRRLDMPHIKISSDDAGLGHVLAAFDAPAGKSGKAFTVLLNAHLDAVGMRVSYIDERGFCFLKAVGGVDLLSLKGHKVKIQTTRGFVQGLIQGLPIHHAEDERNKTVVLEQFFVRTEFSGKPSSASPIRVGDPVVFDEAMGRLGDDLLIGPGFDNRLGILMMTELLRVLKPSDLKIGLCALASSGEEIGCRGVRAIAQKLNPDLAIVLDVTNATDYPGANLKKWGQQYTGRGPILARGYNTRTLYNEKLMQLAAELKLPFQLRAEDITPTDGREIDEAGVPTLVVRIPGCMLHTSNDMVNRHDIETTLVLLREFLVRLPQ